MPVSVFQELYEARANDGDTHPIGIEAIAACATLDAPAATEPIVWGWDLGRSQSWTAGWRSTRAGRSRNIAKKPSRNGTFSQECRLDKFNATS